MLDPSTYYTPLRMSRPFAPGPTPPPPPFADDFDDNSVDSAKWTIEEDGTLATLAETSSQLQVTPPSSQAGNNFKWLLSVPTFSFGERYAQVEAVQVTTNGNAVTEFYVESSVNADDWVRFAVENGIIYAQYSIGGSTTTVGSTTYNGTNHRWWKIREAAGVIYYEVSANGTSWNAFQNWTHTDIDFFSSRVRVGAGTYASQATPGVAIFDNLSTDLSSAGDSFFIPEVGDWVGQGILIDNGTSPSWELFLTGAAAPCSCIEFDNKLYLYYVGADGYDVPEDTVTNRKLGVATSTDGGHTWTKYGSNPILSFSPNSNIEEGIWSAVALVEGGTVHLWYGALRWTGGSNVDTEIRYVSSTDGFTFSGDTLIRQVVGEEHAPVAVFKEGSTYYLYCTGDLIGGKGPIYHISGTSATSLGSVTNVTSSQYTTGPDMIPLHRNYSLFHGVPNDGTTGTVHIVDRTNPNVFWTRLKSFTGWRMSSMHRDSATGRWLSFLLQLGADGNGEIEVRAYPTFAANLSDNFNDNSRDTAKWDLYEKDGTATVVTEQNQRLEVSYTATTGLHYEFFRSVNTYNFKGRFAQIELVQAPPNGGTADAIFDMRADDDNRVEWVKEGASIYAIAWVGGTNTSQTSIAYSATDHRWLRIRELNGVFYWDRSADGVTWVEFKNWTNTTITVTAMKAVIGGGTYESTTVGDAHFDNFSSSLFG